jgi:S-adenosylmethionine:tRNA ribosyltransferase-isomerase
MLLADFDFFLPDHLIAQSPAPDREGSRMLIVDRSDGTITDGRFSELPEILRPNDLLVMNNTKVFPARLFGKSETGANVEIFLVREIGNGTWEALARPARRLRPGKHVVFSERLAAEVTDRLADGKVEIRFEFKGSTDLAVLIDEVGRTPLPPYIKRKPDEADLDRERYQTVYAKKRGAIAAPTAGLHFTPEVLANIERRGVETAEITLHVGYGTFEPVRFEDLTEHSVMPEEYEIDATTARQIELARADGRRIVAVGTTTTRALESNIDENGRFTSARSHAGLTITPGYRFQAVGALLTNFHLPKSSLLVLTSTFGGHELIMKAYRHAVAAGYRFYSYGDCMLIV